MPQSVETHYQLRPQEPQEAISSPYESEEAVRVLPENNAISEEELKQPTASTMRKAARTLEGLLRRNPEADFDPSKWLNNPEGDDDSALYARTLDGLGEDENRSLTAEEMQVFANMVTQVRLNKEQLQARLAEKLGTAENSEPEALREAREYREEKRGQLAELYARRQKRLAGFDFMGDNSFGKQALAFRRKRDTYNDAVQRQIALEVINRKFDSEESRDGFIALRTVQLANELTNDIAKNYSQNNRLLGKTINFLAGRKQNGEPETSKAKKWGRRVLSYGIIPGAFLGLTVATGGSLAVVGAAGAWTGTKLYSVFEAKHRYERKRSPEGLLTQEAIKAKINDAPDEKRINGTYERLNAAELIGSKIGRAALFATNTIEKDTSSEQKKRLVRAFGSVAAGTAVAFSGHYLGAWLHGGENSTSAGNEPSHGWFGQDPSQHSTPPVPETHDALSTIYAHQNMGWYEAMQQMDIDPAQRHEVLLRAAPAMYKHGLAYQMADGLPGIPSTGNIPQLAIDMLNYAAGR